MLIDWFLGFVWDSVHNFIKYTVISIKLSTARSDGTVSLSDLYDHMFFISR